jgi:hypothetical protein
MSSYDDFGYRVDVKLVHKHSYVVGNLFTHVTPSALELSCIECVEKPDVITIVICFMYICIYSFLLVLFVSAACARTSFEGYEPRFE